MSANLARRNLFSKGNTGMLVYEYKVDGTQKQYAAIEEAIRTVQFIRNTCLWMSMARIVTTCKRFGTDGLLWWTSNRHHCVAWWNEESPVISAGECQAICSVSLPVVTSHRTNSRRRCSAMACNFFLSLCSLRSLLNRFISASANPLLRKISRSSLRSI